MVRGCVYAFTVWTSLPVLACGGGGNDPPGDPGPGAVTAQEAPAKIQPCELLSDDQVETVLAEHDEGSVIKGGGSLIDGVDSYQCSYSNENGDLLTLVLTVAPDDERFSQIEPNPSTRREMYPDTFRDVQVGDRGWVSGAADDMKVTAIKGHSVIDLELLASDAGEKADALVALASAVADRIE
jgi:hypothetical protein